MFFRTGSIFTYLKYIWFVAILRCRDSTVIIVPDYGLDEFRLESW